MDQGGRTVSMQQLSISVIFVALLLTCHAATSKSQKPVKSTTSLSADEIAIYKAVLRTYSGDKDVNLNIAATTVAWAVGARVLPLRLLSHLTRSWTLRDGL